MNSSHLSVASPLGEIMRCYTIRFDRCSSWPADRVWRAITNASELSTWMGYPARVDLRVGGDYFLDFGRDSEENLDGLILSVEHERRLRYAWGFSVLEWTLADDETGGCRYSFVHHGMPVRGIPEEEGVASGWHAWLDALDAHLDGEAIDRKTDSARCRELDPQYRRAIEAAVGSI